MDDLAVSCLNRESEAGKVEAWRLSELLKADYPLDLAERVAARPDVDLHRAVELVKGGCPPGLAVEILL